MLKREKFEEKVNYSVRLKRRENVIDGREEGKGFFSVHF